MKLIETTKVTN